MNGVMYKVDLNGWKFWITDELESEIHNANQWAKNTIAASNIDYEFQYITDSLYEVVCHNDYYFITGEYTYDEANEKITNLIWTEAELFVDFIVYKT